jgi:hypothetical protein
LSADSVSTYNLNVGDIDSVAFKGRVDFHSTVFMSALLCPLKFFRIDHPLDPANKYLNNSAVESPDMKNIYDGVVTLDADGEAVVELPEWFEALNRDFRYQVTPVGRAAPNLHISERISNNRFKISGGAEGIAVCWQVTGTRKDRVAEASRVAVEEEKITEERGLYLHPELYGESEERSIHRAHKEEHRRRAEEDRRRWMEEMRRLLEGHGRHVEEYRRRIEDRRTQETDGEETEGPDLPGPGRA